MGTAEEFKKINEIVLKKFNVIIKSKEKCFKLCNIEELLDYRQKSLKGLIFPKLKEFLHQIEFNDGGNQYKLKNDNDIYIDEDYQLIDDPKFNEDVAKIRNIYNIQGDELIILNINEEEL